MNDAFVLEEAGEDKFGMLFEKRNAGFSTVRGGTIELRANYDRQYQIEAGITIQSSKYDKPIQHSLDLDANSRFLKSPDQYVQTEEFLELNTKLIYNLALENLDTELQIFGGIQNILNNYQKDFDTGKYRDSNYVYSPSRPRTYFIGIKIKSL